MTLRAPAAQTPYVAGSSLRDQSHGVFFLEMGGRYVTCFEKWRLQRTRKWNMKLNSRYIEKRFWKQEVLRESRDVGILEVLIRRMDRGYLEKQSQ